MNHAFLPLISHRKKHDGEGAKRLMSSRLAPQNDLLCSSINSDTDPTKRAKTLAHQACGALPLWRLGIW